MRSHKALLKFDESLDFLERLTRTYIAAGVEQVIVVINTSLAEILEGKNTSFLPGVEFVVNANPEWGRFHSLQMGLKNLKSGNYTFFQNIDNPFTSLDLLSELIVFKDKADVIIPTFQNKSGHPVLINPVVAGSAISAIDKNLRINEFLKQFEVKRTEVQDSRIHFNINTWADYLNAGFKD
jgi:CTP:molybdopterin cytidylyltransferase MocA